MQAVFGPTAGFSPHSGPWNLNKRSRRPGFLLRPDTPGMQIRLQVHNKHGYPRSGITGKRPAERLSERAIRLWTGNYADKTTGAATESASVGPKRGSCRLFLVQQLAFRRTAARRTSINTLAGPVSCCTRYADQASSAQQTRISPFFCPASPANGLPSVFQSAQYVSGRVIMRIRPRERQRKAPPLGEKGLVQACKDANCCAQRDDQGHQGSRLPCVKELPSWLTALLERVRLIHACQNKNVAVQYYYEHDIRAHRAMVEKIGTFSELITRMAGYNDSRSYALSRYSDASARRRAQRSRSRAETRPYLPPKRRRHHTSRV